MLTKIIYAYTYRMCNENLISKCVNLRKSFHKNDNSKVYIKILTKIKIIFGNPWWFGSD